MVYILELETSQTNAIRILIDTISSVTTDVKFTFCPYYIDKTSTETDADGGEEEENNENELVTETNEPKAKQVGGLIIKEINKSLKTYGVMIAGEEITELGQLFNSYRSIKNLD